MFSDFGGGFFANADDGLVVKVDGEVPVEDFTATLGIDGENTRVMRGAGGFFGVARTGSGDDFLEALGSDEAIAFGMTGRDGGLAPLFETLVHEMGILFWREVLAGVIISISRNSPLKS